MVEETNAQDAGSNAPAEGETLDTLGTVIGTEGDKPREDTVPLKKYMQEKDGRKASDQKVADLEKEVASLRANSVEMTVGDVNSEARRIAAKYETSEEFVAEIFSGARKFAEAEFNAKVNPKLNAIEQEKAAQTRDNRFEDAFTKTLSDMPEFKGIVSKEAIKALAFNPANAKKTMAQIIEETYGAAVPGKKTIETGQAGKTPEEVNITSPKSKEDFDRINADPEAKKRWSAQMQEDLQRYL